MCRRRRAAALCGALIWPTNTKVYLIVVIAGYIIAHTRNRKNVISGTTGESLTQIDEKYTNNELIDCILLKVAKMAMLEV